MKLTTPEAAPYNLGSLVGLVLGVVDLRLLADKLADLDGLRVLLGPGAVRLVVLERGVLQRGAIEEDREACGEPCQRADAEGDVEVLLAIVDESIRGVRHARYGCSTSRR